MSLKLESRGAEEAGEKSQEAVNLIIRKEVEREFRRKLFSGTEEVSIFLYKHAHTQQNASLGEKRKLCFEIKNKRFLKAVLENILHQSLSENLTVIVPFGLNGTLGKVLGHFWTHELRTAPKS